VKNNDGEKCYCGKDPRHGISGTPKNPGRKFKTCPDSNPNPMGPKTGCKYFVWLEPTKDEVDKVVVAKKLDEVILLLKLVMVMLVIIAGILCLTIVPLKNKHMYFPFP